MDGGVNFYKYINNFERFSEVDSILLFGDESILDKVNITISIPTYKRGKLLRESLYSALCQVGVGNYAVVVVDNDSDFLDDENLDLIKSLNDDRVLYYKNRQNIGMFGNQNRCFELPKSEWVVLLHDDDLLLPNFLYECVKAQEQLHCDAIQPKRFYLEDRLIYTIEKRIHLPFKYKRVADIDNLICFEAGTQSCGFFRRSIVLDLGGFNPEFYPTSDYCLGMSMAVKYSFYILNKKLSIYRYEVNASLSHSVITKTITNDYYLKNFIMHRYRIPNFIRKGIIDYMACLLIQKNKKINKYQYNGKITFSNPSRFTFYFCRVYINIMSYLKGVFNKC